jgi:long-chain acyl-CoA synthetase
MAGFVPATAGSRGAEGTYWFAARIKDVIVRNTAKLTPGEVEAALDLYPDVKSAAAIGLPNESEGEVPVAFIVAEPNRALSAEALTQFLETRIARYKIPDRYFFLTALPLTRSGKIDHKALRAMVPANASKP